MSAIILINPKYPHNVAAAIRACSCFGINDLFWTGDRVDPSEYERLPREERMKGYKDVTWKRSDKPFHLIPARDQLHVVAVELVPGATSLVDYEHPHDSAVYIFGPEDGTIPQVYRRWCHRFLYIPSAHCLNLAAALNVVLYDRRAKRINAGLEGGMLQDYMQEDRGEIAAVAGWDGK